MQGFNEWSRRHAAMFSFRAVTDPAMMLEWEGSFDRHGFTIQELDEATDYIASLGENMPVSRVKNLEAINSRIRQRRKEMWKSNQESGPDDSLPPCGDCQGTGWVEVPHLQCVVDGSWVCPWYTCVVICRCRRGDKVYATFPDQSPRKIPKPLRIEMYEGKNPSWFQQKCQRKNEKVWQSKALAAAYDGDQLDPKTFDVHRALGQVMGRLKDRVRETKKDV